MILVVDDNRDLLRGLCDTLTGLGYHVTGANDGEEALTVYGQTPGVWKLVITDVKMPKVNGLELIEKLQEKKYSGQIIVLSGFLDQETQSKLKVLKVPNVLSKPFKLEDLSNLVGALVPRK